MSREAAYQVANKTLRLLSTVNAELGAAASWQNMLLQHRLEVAKELGGLLLSHAGETVHLHATPSWMIVTTKDGRRTHQPFRRLAEGMDWTSQPLTGVIESVQTDWHHQELTLFDKNAKIGEVAGYLIPLITIESLEFNPVPEKEDCAANHSR